MDFQGEMTATTYPQFNDRTEGLEVAAAFADQVRGKTIIVTGVNRQGIGYTTAEAFASQSPAHIVIAGRSPAKVQESIDALRASYPDVDYRFLQVDLSSQKSVRAAAAELLSWADLPAVDILVNSGAVMALPERTIGEDGVEMHFATNHVGHFLLSCLIMPKLIKAAEANPKGATRIVNVTALSPVTSAIRWSDINFGRKSRDLPETERPNYDVHRAWGVPDPENASYIPLEGYHQSKVANLLFSIAATRRLYERHGILSLAVHPGIMQTELMRDFSRATLDAIDAMHGAGVFSFRSLGAGAATSVVAALDPKLGPPEARGGKENQGAYLADCQISDKARPLAQSSDEAERLWKLSEELVKEEFSW
ncbi:Short-chain dehydrogenase TIC 32 A, chloroplastic [Paramyrothecium foliicola]|nr:Short-chain dehydrogenase TIC 32 A, chloroplastic [Paramyrothecium foliicola]